MQKKKFKLQEEEIKLYSLILDEKILQAENSMKKH